MWQLGSTQSIGPFRLLSIPSEQSALASAWGVIVGVAGVVVSVGVLVGVGVSVLGRAVGVLVGVGVAVSGRVVGVLVGVGVAVSGRVVGVLVGVGVRCPAPGRGVGRCGEEVPGKGVDVKKGNGPARRVRDAATSAGPRWRPPHSTTASRRAGIFAVRTTPLARRCMVSRFLPTYIKFDRQL
jgi:hypothetical protein